MNRFASILVQLSSPAVQQQSNLARCLAGSFASTSATHALPSSSNNWSCSSSFATITRVKQRASKNEQHVTVILLKSIARLGKRGDVVNTNPGWVRSQLFPKGQVLYATPGNLALYKEAVSPVDTQSPEYIQRGLFKLLKSLTTAELNISRRSDWMNTPPKPDEMLGSVTVYDIKHAVEGQLGIALHDSHLLMQTPITTFGTFEVGIDRVRGTGEDSFV
eukprot:gene4769-34523_t